MFITWRQRPVKGYGGGPFLVDHDYDASPWRNLRCRHRGEGRVAWTPLLVIAERVEGKPRQRVIYRFPSIRSCCIADGFARAAWWHDVRHYLDHVNESYCEEGTYLPRDKSAILAKLRSVVPRPGGVGLRNFTAMRLEKEAERKARDDADRAYFWAEADRQERARTEERAQAQREADEWFRAAFARFDEAPAEAFEVLGLAVSATLEQIKAAHRRLAKQHHPDKGGDPAKFREVQVAYEKLRADFERRATA